MCLRSSNIKGSNVANITQQITVKHKRKSPSMPFKYLLNMRNSGANQQIKRMNFTWCSIVRPNKCPFYTSDFTHENTVTARCTQLTKCWVGHQYNLSSRPGSVTEARHSLGASGVFSVTQR
jgi:hypothetical protein